jgi:uncharacterized membrane protein YbhN (UPF0104 family)
MLIVIGAASLILGLILFFTTPDTSHGLNTLSGLLGGIGAALLCCGISWIIKRRRLTPTEIKEQNIEATDERNQMISRIAFVSTAIVGMTFCFITGVVFFALGDTLVGYLFIAGTIIQLVTYLIAYNHTNRRY